MKASLHLSCSLLHFPELNPSLRIAITVDTSKVAIPATMKSSAYLTSLSFADHLLFDLPPFQRQTVAFVLSSCDRDMDPTEVESTNPSVPIYYRLVRKVPSPEKGVETSFLASTEGALLEQLLLKLQVPL